MRGSYLAGSLVSRYCPWNNVLLTNESLHLFPIALSVAAFDIPYSGCVD